MQRILMPVCGSITQRLVLIQLALRSSTDHHRKRTDVECAGGSLQTFQDILLFCDKNLSGLGELVILKNVNQTSFVMQVALKTWLEAAYARTRTRCHVVYERR